MTKKASATDSPWRALHGLVRSVLLVLLASAAGTALADDDDTRRISIGNVTVAEGGVARFTVTLSRPSRRVVSVKANTADGSAAASLDYVARRDVTISFAPGITAVAFDVITLADGVAEGNETFSVNLRDADNASLGTRQAVATITNVGGGTPPPPPPPTGAPRVSINDVSIIEGGMATFTVSLSAAASAPVTMTLSTANGSALAGSDYTAVAARALTIAAGHTSVTTTIATINDTAAEAGETFVVNLASLSSNATFAKSQGVATILDNDSGGAAAQHATISLYEGPQTCIRCHENSARQMHGSLHYQQHAAAPNATNIVAAGKTLAGEGPAGRGAPVVPNLAIGINSYCGTHENSPRSTCANCHVGNGRWPKKPAQFAVMSTPDQAAELANIDCLMCHQQAYKRFPDTSTAFTPLTMLNLARAADGTLVLSIGSQLTLTGFLGQVTPGPAGDFQFRPAGAAGSLLYALPAGTPMTPMALTTEQAAQTVHRTTRQSCLNCHAGAGGANGAKRGDLSSFSANPPVVLDMHMSSAAGGANLTCSACHNVAGTDGKSTHRVRGRGLDLRANDTAARFTCDAAGCHTSTPHGAVTNGTQLNRHTAKVACQTCHIPTYAKVVATATGSAGMPTEVVRDWSKPVVSQTACSGRGGWLPEDIRASNLRPSYAWFDGTSRVTYVGEPVSTMPTKPLDANIAAFMGLPTGTAAYTMGAPNGTVNTAAAKIYPMKEHWSKMAVSTATNTLVPQSTFEFFRTGSFCRAVAIGMGLNADTACAGAQNTGVPAGARAVPVHTYQTLNHGVEPQSGALGANNACGSCHNVIGMTGGPARMDLKGQMGYALRTGIGIPAAPSSSGNWTCTVSCHGSESGNFASIHARSEHRQRGCSSCHALITGR